MKNNILLHLLNETNKIHSIKQDEVPEIFGIFTNNYWVGCNFAA